jgi:tRNA 2-selenouridine synthase
VLPEAQEGGVLPLRSEAEVSVAQVPEFDAVIDVRSPSEFAEDRIPRARNLPVLDDTERARVGTLYKQVSAFEARKVGAALTARNIAMHIERELLGHPKGWRPLVYCWRGGKRSESMAHVLREVGWPAARLAGGYRAYRRTVLEDLERLPAAFQFRVICGRTGSGKSRLLAALAQAGAQVLDLEALAQHRGSVLGNLPDAPQPTQKWFESLVRERLAACEPSRPVFVEAESRRIGRLTVPEALMAAIREGTCLSLATDVTVRVALLVDEYAHLVADVEALCAKLALLTSLHGRERIAAWQSLARAGRIAELVADLLEHHYDPAYLRSTERNFVRLAQAVHIPLTGVQEEDFASLARRLAAQG